MIPGFLFEDNGGAGDSCCTEGPGKRRRMRTRRESGLSEKKMGVVWDLEVSWGSSGDTEEVAG